MRIAVTIITAMACLSVTGFSISHADDKKDEDEPVKIESIYRCIGGDFVACLEEAGFDCQAVSPSPIKYLCSLEDRPIFLISESDQDKLWRVQFAEKAPGFVE